MLLKAHTRSGYCDYAGVPRGEVLGMLAGGRKRQLSRPYFWPSWATHRASARGELGNSRSATDRRNG